MNSQLNSLPRETLIIVRDVLLGLARLEDDAAATAAATVPYWAPYPEAVHGHRAAANVLRQGADRIAINAAAS